MQTSIPALKSALKSTDSVMVISFSRKELLVAEISFASSAKFTKALGGYHKNTNAQLCWL